MKHVLSFFLLLIFCVPVVFAAEYKFPVKPGVRNYLQMEIRCGSCSADAKMKVRLALLRQKKRSVHAIPVLELENGKSINFLYAFDANKDALEAEVQIDFFNAPGACAEQCRVTDKLPSMPQGELIHNGSFETASPGGFTFHYRSKNQRCQAIPGKLEVRRTRNKAYTGNCSLELINGEKEGSSVTVSAETLPVQPGTQYTFRVRYYVVSAAPRSSFSARIQTWGPGGSARPVYPAGSMIPGKWHQLCTTFCARPGDSSLLLSLHIAGAQKVYIDDFSCVPAAEKKNAAERRDGTFLLQNSHAAVWAEPVWRKVPYEGIPQGLKTRKCVTISAAANEKESVLLGVTPAEKGGTWSLDFTDFRCGGEVLAKSCFSIRLLEYICLKNPDNPKMKGYHSDPLVEGTVCKAEKAGRNLPFCITCAVPARQRAGVYGGKIRLLCDGKLFCEIPMQIKVRSFALPEQPFLNTAMSTGAEKEFRKHDRRSAEVIFDDMMRLLGEMRMENLQRQFAPRPDYKIVNGKMVIPDWSKFDEAVSYRIKNNHIRSMKFPHALLGVNSGWFNSKNRQEPIPFLGFDFRTKEGQKRIAEYFRLYNDHMKEKFPGIRNYIHIYDEPPRWVEPQLRILQETIKKGAPDCRIFTTTGLASDLPVDAWVIPLSPSTYLPEKQKAAVACGNEIWYYNWSSELNDLHYIRNRIYPWRVYAADGQGALMWRTMQIPAGVNPWTELDKTYYCGSATFILPPYQGKGGVVPTLRLFNMRDGIDDFDYLKLLERKLEHYHPGNGRKFVLDLLYALFTEPPFDHSEDREKLAALREKIGDELDRIDSKPAGAWVTSVPAAERSFDLPEVTFTAYAPAGTPVLLEGKTVGKTDAAGKIRFKTVLQKFGVNLLAVNVGGKKFDLTYTLLEDPNIAELKKFSSPEAKVLLEELEKAPASNAELRKRVAGVLQKAKRTALETELKKRPRHATELGNHFRKRAKELFDYGLFDRAQKMLNLAAAADRGGDMKDHAVKLAPVEYKDHPALRLDNGRIALTVLETGGRVISFKADGVECFNPGSLSAILNRKERAVNNVPRKRALSLGGYGGFEDAGGGSSLWPFSFTDWDLQFDELSPDKIRLTFSTMIPESPFLLRRTISLARGAMESVWEYEITNTQKPEFASDDPKDFQLSWRGRFLPGIGGTPEGDHFVIPSAEKMPAYTLDSRHPLYFYRISVPLAKNSFGVFKPALKTGVVMKGGPELNFGYIWYNTKKELGESVYTLEFLRSFRKKGVNNADNANSAFLIPAGKTLSFTITVRGVSGVQTEAEFRNAAGL